MKLRHRILFIGTLPPPVHGSAVMSQQIKDSKVINDAFDCEWINIGTSRAMDEIGKKNPAKIFRLFSALLKEFWNLLTRQYNLCYLAITCHGKGFLKDAPFVLLCKLFCRKIVIHQHNKGMAKDINRWPYSWLLPTCYKNAKVILLSWHLYPDIEKVVKKEDVFICPNGIELIACKETCKNLKNETNRIPRLLFLSNLIESKGVFVLLDALKDLKEIGYSFICDFVGGETKEIDAHRFSEEVEKRGLGEVVAYHGRKYGEEKASFFENADIFVHPTMEDCFPLVLLEAMQYRLPIVTTDEGGIPDIVESNENGLIARKNDAGSLAKCIERLILNSDMRFKMGEEGYKRFAEQFTEEIFHERMKGILLNVLKE